MSLLTKIQMKSIKIFFLVSIFSILFSGCVGQGFESLNRSESGVLIEKILPKDTWMVVSVTTKDEGQRAAFDDFIAKFSDGEGFMEKMQSSFDQIGMDYETDVKPILGENGFRFVMAYSGTDTYAVMTVADTAKAQEWLDAMVARGEATMTQLSDTDVYVTAGTDAQGESYTALLGDMLVVTGSSSSLVNASGQFKASDAESLLDNTTYMDSVNELSGTYIGYIYTDSEGLEKVSNTTSLPGVFGAGSSLLSSQIFSFGFEDSYIVFYGYANGDQEKIDEAGIGLDELQGDRWYLAENVPSGDLVFYDESGSIDKLIDFWVEKSGGNEVGDEISTYVTQYLGMDFEEDLKSFLDKGYALSINGGNDLLPGISIVIDASSNLDSAKEFVDKIDAQIASIVMLMQYDASGIGTAFSQNDLEVLGSDFRAVNFDFSGFESLVAAETVEVVEDVEGGVTTATPTTTAWSLLKGSLIYGVTEDGLLIISTYPEWELFDGEGSVAASQVFANDADWLGNYDDNVFFLDFEEVIDYMDVLDQFSSLIGQVVPPENSGDLKSYLDNLDSLIFGVKASRYDVEMKGRVGVE
ncbi:hypothetical protein A2344_00350 [Candidatus Peregrinibacteria bacterium RIFOXYB12_FULL_41_12]|nr:MAG: hypothetical protein A2244_01765 [Candidatus Peregrinibacteria bacterium RIFOXYA2_FULL_41_18]OGJ49466.1 MAG: hypothetical protein A2344_00350 [Candidatus Peregrinibacteria bacterium RIFOXYB12_FULL_41_12]OGJ52909.1 MAG: hypothetical protein A2448_02065 [Candidatus Peregrinibacteria bacterium RIFOXYC2_FULL_41_22]